MIADAANYLEVGRRIWCSAAQAAGADIHAVEVVCTDEGLHRARLAARKRGLEPFPEPTWADVVRQRNETEAWSRDRLVLDSVAEVAANVERALAYLA